MLKKLFKRIDQRFSIYTLCKVICVLLILFLLIKTQVVWGSWAGILRSVMQPFVIGFVLARYKQLQKLHGQLILCNLSRVNQTLFKMSGIFQIMKHERNEVKL